MTYEGEIIREIPAKHPHLIRAEMRRAKVKNQPRCQMVWAVAKGEGDPQLMLTPDEDARKWYPNAEIIPDIKQRTAA